MPSHHLISDPYLHEPKGISTANEGMVYVSDGSGSGQWVNWPFGKAFYQHSATGQVITPTPSLIEIDGQGSDTQVTQLPREIRGSGNLWDEINNKLTPIRLNDVYQVRLDLPITLETGTPGELAIQFEAGATSGITNVVATKYTKLGRSTPYETSFDVSLGILTPSIFANGVRIFASVDTGSITIGAPSVFIVKTGDGVL